MLNSRVSSISRINRGVNGLVNSKQFSRVFSNKSSGDTTKPTGDKPTKSSFFTNSSSTTFNGDDNLDPTWRPLSSSFKRGRSNFTQVNKTKKGHSSHQPPIFEDVSEAQPVLNPRTICSQLDEFVIGQDELKRTLSVAIFNHYIRVQHNANLSLLEGFSTSGLDSSIISSQLEQPVMFEKSNVLILGPTGSGKTLIAKSIAQLLNVPFSMNDASPFTQTGYVGDDVDVCISRLLQNAEYDVQRAERGIVFIDEIDKLAKRSDNTNLRDVAGEGVQQALLRILEGTTLTITPKQVPSRNGGMVQNSAPFQVDTTNILFILSGAFVGMEKIISERLNKKSSIGFSSPLQQPQESANLSSCNNITPKISNTTLSERVEPEDIIKFGFIPEFTGRIPAICQASQLTIEELCRILTEPRNAIIKQYTKLFELNNISLMFHPDSIPEIAKEALSKKTGARGLRRILETILQDSLFEYPGTDIRYLVVTKDTVIKGRNGGVVLAFNENEAAGIEPTNASSDFSNESAEKQIE